MKKASISVTKSGPYLVEGSVPLADQHIVTNAEGESLDWREGESLPYGETYALCRCGQSGTKPFCDGSHKRVHVNGAETASREPYETMAGRIEGPTMVLEDAESLCAFGRFCDPHGQVWNLVGKTDQAEARKLVEQEAGDCPGGRLVAKDRATGKAIEPHFEPSIGLVQDTAKKISGPIWVRGESRSSAPTALLTRRGIVSQSVGAVPPATSRSATALTRRSASTIGSEQKTLRPLSLDLQSAVVPDHRALNHPPGEPLFSPANSRWVRG
jgi:CDGSH-type Zn-finger protein